MTGESGVCAVVVLYRERSTESRTLLTLQKALHERPELARRLLVCIYDNSPDPQPMPDPLPAARTRIFQPGVNQGLPAAYNQALDVAFAEGFPWLLLLDSDTGITASFVGACLRAAADLESSPEIAAIVPHVVEGQLTHSPRWVHPMRRREVPLYFSGIVPHEVIALNSGTLVRVSALLSIGKFTSQFWLDYLDYWLFRVLQKRGFRVFVLNERLEHSLSLTDMVNRMPMERYRNMLDAEREFFKHFGSPWERIRLKLILLKRAANVSMKPGGRPFLRPTLDALMKRDF